MNKNNKISIVYFSSPSEMTRKFVEKLGFENYRIPLKPNEPELLIKENCYYVLATPTLGGGNDNNKKNAVPKQVIKFLNNEKNRKYCIGIIASGNMNFGKSYGLAGHIISKKLNVPLLAKFELSGLPEEDTKIKEIIKENWNNLIKNRKNENI